MAILLAFYSAMKYFSYLIFSGPLNFNIELLFWIFNGLIFGPFKGPVFSIICDTLFSFITTGLSYWMIEYAIIAPLVSLISWLFMKIYKENNVKTIIYSSITIVISIISALIIFFFQLINHNFKYEGINSNKIFPIAIYFLISFMCVFLIGFLIYSILKFNKTKNWDHIKRIYTLSLIVLIIVIFRWLWGPYAYLKYLERFTNTIIDFNKRYTLLLFGIVSKTYLTIPLASIVAIPVIQVIDKFKYYEQFENKYI